MNDLFQIAPSLLPIQISIEDKTNVEVSYRGYVNLKVIDYLMFFAI
jgi:hypothetical protein